MNVYNTFLFCLFIFLYLNKRDVKKGFKIYFLYSENSYAFQKADTTLNILKTAAKTCENVLRLNMPSTQESKKEGKYLESVQSSITPKLVHNMGRGLKQKNNNITHKLSKRSTISQQVMNRQDSITKTKTKHK